MTFAPSIITNILIAPDRASQSPATLSIGIAVDTGRDGGRVFWGDCLFLAEGVESPSTIRHWIDLSTQALRGQRVESFRDLCDRLRPCLPSAGESHLADAVRAALQQGLSAAVAEARHQTVAEALTAAYELSLQEQPPYEVPLFLEISDFAATAERIDQMLSLRPAGIGYRLTGGQVAAAIGENAQHLQRFVRELGRRAGSMDAGGDNRPIFYLGLNGAFGELAGDPVRNIGKVLGNCVGLQDAAGGRRLILEQPILLEDTIAQSSNLHRLKDALYRRWDSHKRGEPLRLVARGSHMSDHELALYVDTQAVHGLIFDFSTTTDVDGLMRRLVLLHNSGLDSYLSLDPAASHRWAVTAADVALAGRAAGLALSFDAGNEHHYLACARRLAEATAHHGLSR
jgi:methylaspartate ammonia-lyase